MPRRNTPRRSRARGLPEPRPPGGLGWARTETGSGGEWSVRDVPGYRSTKPYRCPGCDHEIRPGTAHVVTWPAGRQGSTEDRRHWHNGCWAARGRRGPTGRR